MQETSDLFLPFSSVFLLPGDSGSDGGVWKESEAGAEVSAEEGWVGRGHPATGRGMTGSITRMHFVFIYWTGSWFRGWTQLTEATSTGSVFILCALLLLFLPRIRCRLSHLLNHTKSFFLKGKAQKNLLSLLLVVCCCRFSVRSEVTTEKKRDVALTAECFC